MFERRSDEEAMSWQVSLLAQTQSFQTLCFVSVRLVTLSKLQKVSVSVLKMHWQHRLVTYFRDWPFRSCLFRSHAQLGSQKTQCLTRLGTCPTLVRHCHRPKQRSTLISRSVQELIVPPQPWVWRSCCYRRCCASSDWSICAKNCDWHWGASCCQRARHDKRRVLSWE